MHSARPQDWHLQVASMKGSHDYYLLDKSYPCMWNGTTNSTESPEWARFVSGARIADAIYLEEIGSTSVRCECDTSLGNSNRFPGGRQNKSCQLCDLEVTHRLVPLQHRVMATTFGPEEKQLVSPSKVNQELSVTGRKRKVHSKHAFRPTVDNTLHFEGIIAKPHARITVHDE